LRPETWEKVFTPFKNKYGYGWGIDSVYRRLTISHSGGIHGFSSYILRFPADNVAVIVFDNTGSNAVGRISMGIAAILFNEKYEIPVAKKEISVDISMLKEYVGEYQLAPNFTITISFAENGLKGQATGQPPFDLYAEKENVFFLKVVEAKVEFIKDASGNVTELILYQNGQQLHGKKIK
jgi:hypothetical protein